jgi:hypothetical protein
MVGGGEAKGREMADCRMWGLGGKGREGIVDLGTSLRNTSYLTGVA